MTAGVDSAKPEDTTQLSLFSRGTVTELHGLKAALAKYNGIVLKEPPPKLSEKKQKERRYAEQYYDVRISRTLIVEIAESNLQAIPDPDWWDPDSWATAQQTTVVDSSESATLRNRGNFRATIVKLTEQIRSALAATGFDTTAELFQAIDTDSDGCLDKMELLVGCKSFGVHLAPSEIELIWPIFDADGDGVVSLKEFSDFLEERRLKHERRSSTVLVAQGKIARNRRIRLKTRYQKDVGGICRRLKQTLTSYMEEKGMTSDELFAQVDLDGGGKIDKLEMMHGLKTSGFIISGEDLNMVWPMFCESVQGKISHVEWTEFVTGKTTFNYKHVLDRHLSNLPKIEQGASAVNFQRALPVTPQHGAVSAPQKPQSARAMEEEEEGQLPRRPLFSLPDNHPRVRADAIKSSVQERLGIRENIAVGHTSAETSASTTGEGVILPPKLPDTAELEGSMRQLERQLKALELEQLQAEIEATTNGRRPPKKHRKLSVKKKGRDKGGVSSSFVPFPPQTRNPKPPKRLKPRKPKALPAKLALPVVDMERGRTTRLKPKRPKADYLPLMRRVMSTKELMDEITDNQESPSWVSLVCAMSRCDQKAAKQWPKHRPKPGCRSEVTAACHTDSFVRLLPEIV